MQLMYCSGKRVSNLHRSFYRNPATSDILLQTIIATFTFTSVLASKFYFYFQFQFSISISVLVLLYQKFYFYFYLRFYHSIVNYLYYAFTTQCTH
jgi:hypothetical protein